MVKDSTTLPLWKNIIFSIALFSFSLVIVVIGAELILRVYAKVHTLSGNSEWFYEKPDFFYYIPDPDVGLWMADPDKTRPYINRFGMYDKPCTLNKKEGVLRIAVLGDSYMNGIHAGLGFRMSDLIEQRLGGKAEVLNFAISSIGTVQELIIYEKKVRQFKPDLVIVGFLTGNDVRNNCREIELSRSNYLANAPYCEPNANGSFTYYPARPAQGTNFLSYYLRKHFYVYTFFRMKLIPKIMELAIRKKDVSHSSQLQKDQSLWPSTYLDYNVYGLPPDSLWEKAWKITEYTIAKFKKEVEADGGRFMLLILTDPLQNEPDPEKTITMELGNSPPPGFSVEYPIQRLVNFCRIKNINCVNLLPYFKAYAQEHHLKEPYFSFKNDGHWSRLGHRVAADTAVKILNETLFSASGFIPRQGRVAP